MAGSTGAGGCLHVWRDMVTYNMVDAIVATGASIIDMDFLEALGFKHYQAKEIPDDNTLRSLYIDRIYDTYIDEEELQHVDNTIYEICESSSRAPTPRASSSMRSASGSPPATPRRRIR
jgi:deoxyhypusine synthase